MLKKETINLLGNNYDFTNVLSICIGKSYLFQKRFINSLSEYKNWNTSVKEGILYLDDKVYDVEYIGTTGNDDPFWYSANIEKVIPEEYAKLIVESKKNMEVLNFNRLTEDKIFIVDFINAYNLSMIYIAFAPEDVTYFCGSGNPSIYMFVKNLPENIFEKVHPEEFAPIIMEIISTFDVNHKLLVKSLLIENEIDFIDDVDCIVVRFNEDSILKVDFNDKGLIKGISGGLN